MQTPALIASTRQSSAPGSRSRTPPRGGVSSASASRSQVRNDKPARGANADRINPSVSSCLTRRPRPAPTESRIVISC